MKIDKILGILNTIAPFGIAEAWDNCGLQVGNLNWDVKRVMLGLDVSMPLMQAAQKQKADLVITHHPLIMAPEKVIDFAQMPGSAIEIAATQKIGIVSVHTNLDKANDGLNDYFAQKIDVSETRPFLLDSDNDALADKAIGIGRIGHLGSGMTLKALAGQVKQKLNLTHLRVTGNLSATVQKVALCTGSGGSLLDHFLGSDADVFITGDMKYHDARQIEEHSRALIDVGHFGSEHMAIDLLYEKLSTILQNSGSDIEIEKYKKEKDPFTIV